MGRHSDRDGNNIADAAEAEQDHRAGLTVPSSDDDQPTEAARPRSFTAAAASSVIYGPDIHPTFQAGISIDKIAAEGFSFLAVKASQGTSSSWAAGADTWLDRADALGLVTYVYHYLTTADVNAQAQTAKTAARGRPVMVDCEDGSGNVANVRAFLAACSRIGVRVPLVYIPRWWWQSVGSASLAGLPPIVSSRYLTATGYASAIYSQVPPSFWDSYGGGTTTILQFSDRASVAGKQIDVNAYRGTKDQLRALVYGTPAPAPVEEDMTPDQDARLARVESALAVVIQQLCGEKATITQPWPGKAGGGGWPTFRDSGEATDRLTLVDYLRTIEQDVHGLGGS